MNVDLLSKMIRELLLDNDVVTLPGLGSFVAEGAPASFSDNGFTINPPYRKLYFRENMTGENDLLVDFYASANHVSRDMAELVIGEFMGEVRQLLNSRKNVVFPELGRLRATKENNYFFVPFENLDIYPEGVGMEPIPLKVHAPAAEEVDAVAASAAEASETPEIEVSETPEIEVSEAPEIEVSEAPEIEVSEAPEVPKVPEVEGNEEEKPEADGVSLSDDMAFVELVEEAGAESGQGGGPQAGDEPRVVPVISVEVVVDDKAGDDTAEAAEAAGTAVEAVEEAAVEVAVEPAEESGKGGGNRPTRLPRVWRTVLTVVGIIILLFILVIIVFVILAHCAPDFTDKLLYTKEELDIINYKFQ